MTSFYGYLLPIQKDRDYTRIYFKFEPSLTSTSRAVSQSHKWRYSHKPIDRLWSLWFHFTITQHRRIYSVSQKISPALKFSDIFSQTVGNFYSIFYTPITRSYLRLITNFYSIISNFDKVIPY